MIDTIIFLSDKYPYESGEDFIGNEMAYMKEACKKLYIIPLNARNYSKCRIQEDDKVIIWKGNHRTSKIKKIMKVPFLFLDKNVRADISFLRSCHNLNCSTVGLLMFFTVQFNLETREIRKWLLDRIKKDERILIYSYWLYNTAYVGCKLKECFKRSCVVSRGHRFDIYLERNLNNYLPHRKYIMKGIDKIFAISDDGRIYLQNMYSENKNIFTQRLGTIDYGLNPEKSDETIHIVSCSNINPVKRCHKIVDILKHIQEPVKWIHYGDGPERKKLKQYAEQELPSNIKVAIEGAITNHELMEYYKSTHVDVFINVSESEGIPVSIMEAFSFGIPVIATDVGGTSEIVRDGENGYLVPKDFDERKVSEKIVVLVSKNAETFRLNARESWRKNYSAAKNYKAFFDLLQKTMMVGRDEYDSTKT